jgi:HAD superfamily hydrolase (TIGR01450 family)
LSLVGKRLFLLDMDGTIYLSERLFDGAAEFLQTVKAMGGRWVFLTNNSSRGTDAYIAKMARLGIETAPEDFLTSADAAIRYLKSLEDDLCWYVCGTASLKGQLRDAGIRVAEGREEAEGVLLGYDTELTYAKLEDCCILLGRGVPYVATHPDPVCPTWYGSAPDCGSVMEMLRTCTGRSPRVIGKPKPDMALMAMEKFGVSPAETCLMGDRIYTDIACGVNAGIDTIFVLSGEGTREDIEKYGVVPTWIYADVAAVLNELKKEHGI